MCQRVNCPFCYLKIQKAFKLTILKTLEIETGMADKSSQTDGKNQVWFGEKNENQPNCQCLPLLTILLLTKYMFTPI